MGSEIKMKKILILALAFAVVMMFSVGVMAEDPTTNEPFEIDKGWYTNYTEANDLLPAHQEKTEIGTQYKTVEGVTVTGDTPDYNADDYIGDQAVNVKINTSALIPCYLEMELIGNGGYSKGKSIGADAESNIDRTDEGHWMLFHPEFGGFMDSAWNLLGNADVVDFSTLGPNSGTYLNACDMWTANLFANVDYGFDVVASPLVGPNDIELLMDMRVTSPDVTLPVGEFLEIGTAEVFEGDALEAASIFMQFRVPYNNTLEAGQYDGDITFMMYSL